MASRNLTLVMRKAVVTLARPSVFVSARSLQPCALRLPAYRQRAVQCSPAAVSVRWHSASGSQPKVYDFAAVKEISNAPQEDRVLIDVREPSEYEAGYIPGAINIPVGSSPDALFMPGHEFEAKFGFEKPKAEQELIFYCKAGVRSSAAAQLAHQVGYQNVGEYRGSWLDWQKQGGRKEQ